MRYDSSLPCDDPAYILRRVYSRDGNFTYRRFKLKRNKRLSPAQKIEQDERVKRRRLRQRISARMNQLLRGAKNGRSWEALVGYTVAELRAHLEAQFSFGMSWSNMGEWHIDHRRPIASFEIAGPDCPEFRAAWALSNLQPLWASDNLRKGAKWEAT